jgi:hypothetical protein
MLDALYYSSTTKYIYKYTRNLFDDIMTSHRIQMLNDQIKSVA